MNCDHIFDSSETLCEMSTVKQSPITVMFEKENIILQADPEGNAKFMTAEGTVIHEGKADGSGHLFNRIKCAVNDEQITVTFINAKEVDHYPHCDGEYDRWSTVYVCTADITCSLKK